MPVRAFALLFTVLLVGCSAGRDFSRPHADTFQLGRTTYAQVLERYGDPYRTGTALRNGETVKTVMYSYATATPYVDDVPVRTARFYFLQDTLAGYDFTSSFREDKTAFDSAKVQQIRRGETTRQQVVDLLGQPGGLYNYPVIKGKDDTALVYHFVDTNRTPFVPGSLRVKSKMLVISVDSRGVVTDVDYAESKPE